MAENKGRKSQIHKTSLSMSLKVFFISLFAFNAAVYITAALCNATAWAWNGKIK